ncbi:MAG: hydrogenase maturation nickel metallochaperone HypA [Lachnospiraceae bacterium]|nr:hydrogenase maturation nickel metallochaperone HypA [Lachnospiraceae bacterium]
MSYIARILPMAEDAAQKNHMDRIKNVTLEVGAMTGAMPELLQECYKEAILGTLLEGSELTIIPVDIMAACEDCGCTYAPSKENDYRCPKCHSLKSHIIAGRDVVIKSISDH